MSSTLTLADQITTDATRPIVVEECVALIKDCGFRAMQRTTLYEHVREW